MSQPTSIISSGFGLFARNHTLGQLLSDPAAGINLIAICDVEGSFKEREEISTYLDQNYHCRPEILGSLAETLTRFSSLAAPRAVIINTPNVFHMSAAKEAIGSGFHVYIERPIAIPQDDLPSLLENAKAKGLQVYTGVQRRLEPSYRYIQEAVCEKRGFGKLSSIHCTLAVGERPSGWRTDRALAGGGVIIDNGYHLLDIAAYILSCSGILFSEISAYGIRLYDLIGEFHSIETSACGHLVIGGVTLTFDFSYKVPKGTIFERLEVRDVDGAQITLTRDQRRRNNQPGQIRHVGYNGKIFKMDIGESGYPVQVNDIRLGESGMASAPMKAFLKHISNSNKTSSFEHPCSGEASINTWRLVKAVYEGGGVSPSTRGVSV